MRLQGTARRVLAACFAAFACTSTLAAGADGVSAQHYAPVFQGLRQKGDLAGAERVAREAVAQLQAQLGPNSAEVAAALRLLTQALHDQRRSAEAIPILQRALAIDERNGADGPAVASDLHGLAELLWEQARYAEAEPFARRELAIRERLLPRDDAELASSLTNLAEMLARQKRYAESEPLNRRALEIRERLFGAESAPAAASTANLAGDLRFQHKNAEAESQMRRALAIVQTIYGSDDERTVGALESLASLLMSEQKYTLAEEAYTNAFSIINKKYGKDDPRTAVILIKVGQAAEAAGQVRLAESVYRHVLELYETMPGAHGHETAAVLNNLAGTIEAQGRHSEAESLQRRALAMDEQVSGSMNPETATALNNLALMLSHWGRYDEAESLYRRAFEIDQKALGLDDPRTVACVKNLAMLIEEQGRHADAETLLRRALGIEAKSHGPGYEPGFGDLNNLARILESEGRYADADRLLRRAATDSLNALGPMHPLFAGVRENLALNDEHLGNVPDAASNFRVACAVRARTSLWTNQNAEARQYGEDRTTACWAHLSRSLWAWSAQGGGTAAADRPAALKAEAFNTAQLAIESAAAEALARAAAMSVAQAAGISKEAESYEAALRRRDGLDQQLAAAASITRQTSGAELHDLSSAREQADKDIAALEQLLRQRTPRYWDLRAPQPLAAGALQAKDGLDSALLRADEALILVMARSGPDKGLVFAVTKERLEWAQLALSGDEIKSRIGKLRAQIDPEGYGLRGIGVVKQDGAVVTTDEKGFSRQAAYELYQAILGDPSIQAAIGSKSVLLFVPSGAFTSLPPSLLITAPPPGGAAHDADPEALRATPWLLRAKAISILPSVSSLRTLRQLAPADRATGAEPLLALADPDFERPARAPPPAVGTRVRGYSAYYRDGLPLAEALDGLPRLPGTRVEAEALERALHASPSSLLLGRDASKAQLMARNNDGRLSRVRVLEFATHGLVAGDASDLSEPALVLAAGATPADELLRASEAAGLRLNADWVLLSACNTASPDAPEAQGLSGMSRAFFHAGARSLLVSHWRVRDDVAPRLIPAMLLAGINNPALGHAQALQQAALAILDDKSLDATSPAAWAPFTLVGEAAR